MYYKILLPLNGGMKPETIMNDYIQEYARNVSIRSHTRKDQRNNTIKYTSLQFYYTKEYYHDYKQVKKLSETSLVGKMMLQHKRLLLSIIFYIPQPSHLIAYKRWLPLHITVWLPVELC